MICRERRSAQQWTGAILPLSVWRKTPSDRRSRFTPYRLDSVLYRCAAKHLWGERTYLCETWSSRTEPKLNYFELAASETPLHKIGTDVIGRCWIWIWTWMALWNSICTFILGRGRHSCTTGCSHIFILNSCSSCVACYSLASKLFCALALQKHTADTWQVHLGWGHIFIQTLGKRRGCSED